MLWVNLPVVDTINSKGNKFDTSVKIKVTGESKVNDSTDAEMRKQTSEMCFWRCSLPSSLRGLLWGAILFVDAEEFDR